MPLLLLSKEVLILNFPPSGIASMELIIRFINTWQIWLKSMTVGGRSGRRSTRNFSMGLYEVHLRHIQAVAHDFIEAVGHELRIARPREMEHLLNDTVHLAYLLEYVFEHLLLGGCNSSSRRSIWVLKFMVASGFRIS